MARKLNRGAYALARRRSRADAEIRPYAKNELGNLSRRSMTYRLSVGKRVLDDVLKGRREGVSDTFLDRVFRVIRATPRHTYRVRKRWKWRRGTFSPPSTRAPVDQLSGAGCVPNAGAVAGAGCAATAALLSIPYNHNARAGGSAHQRICDDGHTIALAPMTAAMSSARGAFNLRPFALRTATALTRSTAKTTPRRLMAAPSTSGVQVNGTAFAAADAAR